MSGAIPPLPQYASMAWCLVKAQGQLYLFHYMYASMPLDIPNQLTAMKVKPAYKGFPTYLNVLSITDRFTLTAAAGVAQLV
jgi:hypothetical protein